MREYKFLASDGEMSKLIRSTDWSKTCIGNPDKWPQNLCTVLGIMLSSKFPMFLFWGSELICFYNDAYRPSLGQHGKHPSILGMPAEKAWSEIWHTIKPLIDQVWIKGEATWNENQLIPIFRNGNIEDVYWTFSYSPVKDKDGNTEGVLVICTETTNQITTLKKLEDSEHQFRNLVKEAPIATSVFTGSEFIIELANEEALKLWGKNKTIIGKKLIEALPELKGQPYMNILKNVYTTGETYYGNESLAYLEINGVLKPIYVNFIYKALRKIDNSISGILCMGYDVTEQIETRKKIENSEERFRRLIIQSPIPMAILKGKNHIVEMANTALLTSIWKKKSVDVLGKTVLEIFPELKDQKYPTLLNKVYTTGEAHTESESIIYFKNNNSLTKFYVDFEYAPLFEADNTISGIILTANDVTEKVESRRLLKESAERLMLAVEGTNMATWDLNLQTYDIIYSPRLLKIFGYTEEAKKITHAQMRNLIHADDRKNIVEKAFAEALKTGSYCYEARIIHPDQTIHWIRTRGKIFFNEDKVPTRMLGTTIDITDNKIAEENIAKMAAIVHSSEDAIISKTLEGIIITWNAAAERIFGYKAEEMIGESIIKLIPVDKREEEIDILSKLKKGHRLNHFETKRITKDKKIIDVSLTISPIRDIHENIIGASKIARDITKQKEAERIIKESEEKFRLLADSMPQFIWTSDALGNLNYYNQAVFDYSGLTIEQINKNGWIQIVHPEDREENMRLWMEAVSTGKDFIFEHRFKRFDGAYRWQLSRAIPQRDKNGNIEIWVGSSTDIQEIKELDQQKDYFISMASHELKTPITSVKGYVQILQSMYQNSKDEFLKNSLSIVNKQILTLTNLISDLLDLSKIKSGNLLLNKEKFQINTLIFKIIDEIKHINPDYNINFSGKVDVNIYADKERIGQVLINFLTNAIKYSPHSKLVEVESIIEGSNILILVKDSGIGINKNDQEKIFERFYRVEGKNEKTFPGFGIGLFIASEIIHRHNGKIGVTSELGKGSIFYFSLPLV